VIAEVLEIQAALRERTPVPDEVFDQIFPRIARFRSSVHWTPVEVAIRVAELLEAAPGGQILDVGAGVGKVCIIGALTTHDTAWFGIEKNPAMVRVARKAAERMGVEHRTRFLAGDAMMFDWSTFGGIYLYNPFAESLFTDEEIEPGARRQAYIDEVRAVEKLLDGLGAGARVVTYHGFGGDMPNSLELVVREKVREDEVCLWIHSGRRGTGFHIDGDVTGPDAGSSGGSGGSSAGSAPIGSTSTGACLQPGADDRDSASSAMPGLLSSLTSSREVAAFHTRMPPSPSS
jgi:SAM-dependent methyltransferase